MRIAAVDGGGTTGVAFLCNGMKKPMALEVPPMDAVRIVAQWEPDLIVCESYRPRGGPMTFQPDAMEVIGALRYVAFTDRIPFELQSPADAKRFATRKKLVLLGWYEPTPGGHKNDALSHLLLAIARHYPKELECLIAS